MCAHFGCSYNIFIYRTWKPYSPMHCGIETDCCQIRTWSSLATIPDKMECKIVDIAIGLSARRMRWCQQTLATLKSCDSKRAKLHVVLAWEETKITTGLGCTIFFYYVNPHHSWCPKNGIPTVFPLPSSSPLERLKNLSGTFYGHPSHKP